MKDPKKPSRKFVLIEVETALSNRLLSKAIRAAMFRGDLLTVIQVHVEAAKKEPKR